MTGPAWLEFDASEMRGSFARRPFVIRHRLANHPLLNLPRLVQLAQALPAASVEYNAGNLPIGQEAALTPRTGLSIEETLRQIDSHQSWMVLKNVEQDGEYRHLLDECLDALAPAIEPAERGMFGRQAFVFVSSPGAVTPYHADFEYNFLLQVRGNKTITVFDDQDRNLLSEADRERVVCGGSRNLPFADAFTAKSREFHLSPGDGVHVPLSAPHWVKVGAEVSISFSMTFQSKASARILALHRANRWLRQRGIEPREVGRSQVLDAVKFNAWRIMARIRPT